MPNLSTVPDARTARTCIECAGHRAEHLCMFGVNRVLELCVGPSLGTLENAYAAYDIKVTGNDIDPRWKKAYPKGDWIIGDALSIPYKDYDAVVFAPPLSKGCTGKREDALSVFSVTPSYPVFLDQLRKQDYHGIATMVLPARSLATRSDREEFFRLANMFWIPYILEPLTAGKREIVKYYDVYLDCRKIEY